MLCAQLDWLNRMCVLIGDVGWDLLHVLAGDNKRPTAIYATVYESMLP